MSRYFFFNLNYLWNLQQIMTVKHISTVLICREFSANWGRLSVTSTKTSGLDQKWKTLLPGSMYFTTPRVCFRTPTNLLHWSHKKKIWPKKISHKKKMRKFCCCWLWWFLFGSWFHHIDPTITKMLSSLIWLLPFLSPFPLINRIFITNAAIAPIFSLRTLSNLSLKSLISCMQIPRTVQTS